LQIEWEEQVDGLYLAGTSLCAKQDDKRSAKSCDVGNKFWMGPDCKKDNDLFFDGGSGHLTTCREAAMCATADASSTAVVRCNDPAAQGWSRLNATTGTQV